MEALAGIASAKGVSAAQLALAWALARRSDLVPVVGARTLLQLEETLGALRIVLSLDDMARIEAAFPREAIAGTRYLPHLMKMLDSEET